MIWYLVKMTFNVELPCDYNDMMWTFCKRDNYHIMDVLQYFDSMMYKRRLGSDVLEPLL